MRSFLIAVFLLLATSAQAQITVTGTVSDAQSGETLPSATIQVDGTSRGTVTNAAGQFRIEVSDLPAALIVRYIGYESGVVQLEEDTLQEHYEVQLITGGVVTDEIVVTGDNPAEEIMRRVIRANQERRPTLISWQADAYSRLTVSRDTGIVAIAEGATRAYWVRDRGIREVVVGARGTANLDFFDAGLVSAAASVMNVHDDELDIAGHRIPGPSAPNALRFYRFTLDSIRTLDRHLVYDISLLPRNALQPGFEGHISVLGDEWVIISAELRPNASVRLPAVPEASFAISQQFISIRHDEITHWLPADYRFEATLGVRVPGLRFPEVHLRNMIRLTDYEVNVPMPFELFRDDRRTTVDSAAVAQDSLLIPAIPLEAEEVSAYAGIDSTQTLVEAFRPTGFLAPLVRMSIGREGADSRAGFHYSLRPQLWFNRAEAFHLGLAATVEPFPWISLSGHGGYATGVKEVGYGGALSLSAPDVGDVSPILIVRYFSGIKQVGEELLYPQFITGLASLAGFEDYYDYYRSDSWNVTLGARSEWVDVDVTWFSETYAAAEIVTDFSILPRFQEEKTQLFEGGTVNRGASVRATIGENPLTFGNRLSPDVGFTSAFELANFGIFRGQHKYYRFETAGYVSVATLLRRRLQPMRAGFFVAAGIMNGRTPVIRAFSLEGSSLLIAPTGVMRSFYGQRENARRYLQFNWEHDFRSVPFELIGLHGLADRTVGIHVFGGYAMYDTFFEWEPRKVHEIGIGLSGGFVVPVRIDFTARLDAPGYYVTLALPRIF